MAQIDDLLDHFRNLHVQMLDDIKHWRSRGWRLHQNDEDITEKWLSDQQRRAGGLAKVIAAHEKRNV